MDEKCQKNEGVFLQKFLFHVKQRLKRAENGIKQLFRQLFIGLLSDKLII